MAVILGRLGGSTFRRLAVAAADCDGHAAVGDGRFRRRGAVVVGHTHLRAADRGRCNRVVGDRALASARHVRTAWLHTSTIMHRCTLHAIIANAAQPAAPTCFWAMRRLASPSTSTS